MDVVIVESATKAKTLHRYLGGKYRVLASYGHVRDLPSQNGSVRPDEDFAMDWVESASSRPKLEQINDALKQGAKTLYLATDPDREGEAISWHILESLHKRKSLSGIAIKRIVFHEVTQQAIEQALAHPRDINHDLVEAYFARRALDYLVGFTLSPLLWRKLPGSRSAGRVQSVALRLICTRETEIEQFVPQEYWQVKALMRNDKKQLFEARLTHLHDKKIGSYDLDEKGAQEAEKIIKKGAFTISKHKKGVRLRHPAPPFTTARLQQEAARKLGFSAKRTMRTAQQLYEGIDIGKGRVGLITYMRTDSTHLAKDAIVSLRDYIAKNYGKDYMPAAPRIHKTKAKNAQEAHEAIRPTDCTRSMDILRVKLNDDQRKLYGLIWQRAVASQMADARLEQVTADISDDKKQVMLRANGNRILFDGFLRLYEESVDDASEDAKNQRLPELHEGDKVTVNETSKTQHFTKPPPRYSEASLVKAMEELGIGRPSTYASIIDVLQKRNYVTLEQRRFIPQDRGRIVTCFLQHFFNRYVEYDFTAQLEDQLDSIANGRDDWKKILHEFWRDFTASMTGANALSTRDIIDALNETLAEYLFGEDGRHCPQCENGKLSLKLSRFGAFIGCTLYPECRYSRALSKDGESLSQDERQLGKHPEGGEVTLRYGPYGPYLQWDKELPPEAQDGKKKKRIPKPKRFGLAAPFDAAKIELPQAVQLLNLPREVARFPENGEMITAQVGRFGAYLQCGWVSCALPKDDDVLTVGANRAIELIAQSMEKREKRGDRELGTHPSDDKKVVLIKGRFGFYILHGKLKAFLSSQDDPKKLTLEEALALLAQKATALSRPKKATAQSKSKKPVAKKTTALSKAAVSKAAQSKPAARKKSTTKKTTAARTTKTTRKTSS